MNIFINHDYRAVVQAKMKENKEKRGYQSILATVAGCQQSFFSQVLKDKFDLSADQGMKLARFWDFGELETEYFLALIQLSRAGSMEYKRYLQRRLQSLRQRQSAVTDKFTQNENLPAELYGTYFSVWYYSAIHALVSIERYQSIHAIAERLSLPQTVVQDCLNKLNTFKFVKKVGQTWQANVDDLHLPDFSFMNDTNHSNWRLEALKDLQRKNAESVHYSSVFSISANDYNQIKSDVLILLEKARRRAIASQPEDVYSLNLDFFKV
jgi:uncharacterized protein (TIGR02147 family)